MKPLLLISLTLVLLLLTAGCGTIKPQPYKIVACSDYTKVIDKFTTPNGYYIVVDDPQISNPHEINFLDWNKISIGQFIMKSPVSGHLQGYPIYDKNTGVVIVDLYELDNMGMRDACEVIP